jgi:hypothetical protein
MVMASKGVNLKLSFFSLCYVCRLGAKPAVYILLKGGHYPRPRMVARVQFLQTFFVTAASIFFCGHGVL